MSTTLDPDYYTIEELIAKSESIQPENIEQLIEKSNFILFICKLIVANHKKKKWITDN